MDKNLYEILGVRVSASSAEIKAAFRKLVVKLHPDHGGDQDVFIELTQAYNILMNPIERKLYDETGTFAQASAQKMQSDMIGMLAQALNVVACTPMVQVSDVDFISGLKDMFTRAVTVYRNDIGGMEKEISVYRRMVKQIKRKGEEKNLIADVVEARLKEYEEPMKKAKHELLLSTMILEEMQHYSSLSGLSRHFQAGQYYSEGGYDEEEAQEYRSIPNFFKFGP